MARSGISSITVKGSEAPGWKNSDDRDTRGFICIEIPYWEVKSLASETGAEASTEAAHVDISRGYLQVNHSGDREVARRLMNLIFNIRISDS
jgi:hypothetical protein